MMSPSAARTWGALEIVGVVLTGAAVVWVVGPAVVADPELRMPALLLVALGFAYLVYASPCLLHADPARRRGLGRARHLFVRLDNFREAFIRFGAVGALASVGLVAAMLAWKPETLAAVRWNAVALKLALYVPSAIGQQLVLMAFFLVRLRAVLQRRVPSSFRSVQEGGPVDALERGMSLDGDAGDSHRFMVCAILAVAFGLFHVPNTTMVLLTVPFGFAMAWVYHEHPNLVAAALSHAIVGTVLHRIVQADTRIGPFYGSSEIGLSRVLLPFIDRIIGNVY